MTDLDALPSQPLRQTPSRGPGRPVPRHARRGGPHPVAPWSWAEPVIPRHAAGAEASIPRAAAGGARAAARAAATAGVPLVLVAMVTAAAPGGATHTIAAGETLEAIAARYGTTVTELIKVNNLPGSGDVIRAGAILALPAPPAPVVVTENIAHRVLAGENLTVIAAAHGVTIESLRAANDVGPADLIRAGRDLVVPVQRTVPAAGAAAAPAAPATPASGPTHLVAAGDTVSALAQRYAVSVAAIREANSLDAAGRIRVGQELRLPAGASVASASGENTFAGRTYPPEVVAAADRNRAELAGRTVPSREQVRELIVNSAEEHGVDPNLALAVSYQESGWNARSVSVANAVGAMQVLPGTAQWMSDVLGRELDVLDPQDNITAGVVLLKVLGKAAESEEQAIAAYYQGLRSVRENGPGANTLRYVANVQALKGRFAGG